MHKLGKDEIQLRLDREKKGWLKLGENKLIGKKKNIEQETILNMPALISFT